jgi:hypothetical protein
MQVKTVRYVISAATATLLLAQVIWAGDNATNVTIRNDSRQPIYHVVARTDTTNTFRILKARQEAALKSRSAATATVDWTDQGGERHAASVQLQTKSRCGDGLYLGSVIRIRATGASSAAICWRAWESYEDPQ